jgi:hypothetical protein
VNSWHSYPSIYNLGHRAIAELLQRDVLVEEKVDGSQFSFGIFDGELKCRSKGAQLHVDAPDKMFSAGVAAVKERAEQLTPGWTYRGEYLAKPRHNGLVYSRIPRGHVVLFDVNTAEADYLTHAEKVTEAERLDFDVVPALFTGRLEHITDFRRFLETESILGGQKIEGVVVKPAAYDLFGPDKKVLMGKFVSEAFKEVHAAAWKKDNPTGKDKLSELGDSYCTQARWQKALIHLKERGLIADDVRDIGTLIKEVPEDIKRECEDEIKAALFAWAWPHIRRMTTRGMPEWYKEELLKKQFETP